ncbi:hypothetical protein XNC1_4220 [Xenorhabdus nematophila ATCC 19061]|uniref:DUF7281 domain-containing protein n=1 Tax=Xenorhabdus nematophila (strain ATCC 19061 / DSM 3370 / CCUG 14189 / LMG 1036 / NCIMB 9965 / AN6) TaxID=406817 RepID=D3VDK4_XENNA|nr:DUF2220 family protein [Xenorhabdus nematophila]CBJ92244.1 hypothetical protein XNC1_4220 [Xenorhabdus nematophila ATCC 19061]
MDPLNLGALTWLKALEKRLLSKGNEKKKTNSKTVRQVLAWCLEQDLIPANSLNLPEFTFTRELLNAIATTQQKLNQTHFRCELQTKNRIESALLSDQEIKTAGIRPRQQRVLIHLTSPVFTEQNMKIQVIDTHWQDIPLSKFDVLMVVENSDCFYHLDLFEYSLHHFHSPLIVYRGDKIYGQATTKLKDKWLEMNKPAIYFGDFDPKGASIAIHEGYEAMLLPSLEVVRKTASVAMFPDNQLKFIKKIKEKNTNHFFESYLKILFDQKGLRQQKMQGESLQIVSITS